MKWLYAILSWYIPRRDYERDYEIIKLEQVPASPQRAHCSHSLLGRSLQTPLYYNRSEAQRNFPVRKYVTVGNQRPGELRCDSLQHEAFANQKRIWRISNTKVEQIDLGQWRNFRESACANYNITSPWTQYASANICWNTKGTPQERHVEIWQ